VRRGKAALFKTSIITGLSINLRRNLQRHGIATNDSFRGIHDFTGRIPYALLFQKCLQSLGKRTLVHCHPGLADDCPRQVDSIINSREDEYYWFSSEAFIATLDSKKISLKRFCDLC
jgi:predicted glycoside hydrolase/deacetylase ChbG (UPF0249 family)